MSLIEASVALVELKFALENLQAHHPESNYIQATITLCDGLESLIACLNEEFED